MRVITPAKGGRCGSGSYYQMTASLKWKWGSEKKGGNEMVIFLFLCNPTPMHLNISEYESEHIASYSFEANQLFSWGLQLGFDLSNRAKTHLGISFSPLDSIGHWTCMKLAQHEPKHGHPTSDLGHPRLVLQATRKTYQTPSVHPSTLDTG